VHRLEAILEGELEELLDGVHTFMSDKAT
jgi:hypothetical protein